MALALQTVQIEYWLRKIDSVTLLEARSTGPPSFFIRLIDGRNVTMRPGGYRREGQLCWYIEEMGKRVADTAKLSVISANFELVQSETESHFVTLTGFSVEAVFLKLLMWLDGEIKQH
ncbi:MAG: hypothetical protein RL196_309 [Actinomycetota bacterium]|jgi:hypothetical protein